MKKIISMVMALVMVVMLWGCGSKKTTEVAPVAPPTKTESTASMTKKCDEILKDTYGDMVMTSVENGQYNVAIMEPGITSKIIYSTGLAEGYDELCLNCKNAVGIDTILGICDSSGNLVYVSYNGIDITGSVN